MQLPELTDLDWITYRFPREREWECPLDTYASDVRREFLETVEFWTTGPHKVTRDELRHRTYTYRTMLAFPMFEYGTWTRH